MSGYVDLHCHLLYGVDDGAKTAEETVGLARLLVSLGFDRVAPSPHARPQYARREAVEGRFVEVENLLAETGIPLRLLPNAENDFLHPRLIQDWDSPERRSLGGGSVFLVEAPYRAPLPSLPQLIFQLRVKGIRPLIAHPERCLEFHNKGRAEQAVEGGALLQLDVGALSRRYGKVAEEVALRLLDKGLYAVAATDVHHLEGAQAWLEEALSALERAVGATGVRALLRDGPSRLWAEAVERPS